MALYCDRKDERSCDGVETPSERLVDKKTAMTMRCGIRVSVREPTRPRYVAQSRGTFMAGRTARERSQVNPWLIQVR